MAREQPGLVDFSLNRASLGRRRLLIRGPPVDAGLSRVWAQVTGWRGARPQFVRSRTRVLGLLPVVLPVYTAHKHQKQRAADQGDAAAY